MKKFLGILLIIWFVVGNVYSYGPQGHSAVGAIADARLANTTVASKVSQLLHGLSLRRAATLPDEIKSLDPCGQKKKKSAAKPKQNHAAGENKPPAAKKKTKSIFKPAIPKIVETQLRAFVKANPCTGKIFHRNFHFTDVPVFDDDKYSLGGVGTNKFDIVQMINFCIRVLKNEVPENNQRAITKTIAVILLAHYLGDIHQPLHVGAEYFNSKGPCEPNGGVCKADRGGNLVALFLLINGKKVKAGNNLHSYWDGQAVTTALGSTTFDAFVQDAASNEPANWKLSAPVEEWSRLLADEILPIAKEAHDRLNFPKSSIVLGSSAKEIASCTAEEKPVSSGPTYEKWAGSTARTEIQKGGWRLAALLEAVLQ